VRAIMNEALTVEAAKEKPLFSARCVQVGQGGQYLGFGGTSRLAVFSDRLEIDGLAIYYPYLLSIQANSHLGSYSHVVELVYATADGTREERCFSFRSFVLDKAQRQLDELLHQVTAARAKSAGGAARLVGENPRGEQAVQAPASFAPAASRCRRLADVGNRPAVAVYSARVAFPPCCPVCGADAGAVATLRVTTGFWRYLPGGAMAEWLVPVCPAHRRLEKAITVERWAVDSAEIHFSFSSALYAERFLDANDLGPLPGNDASPLAAVVTKGTRFVVYRYAISAIFFSEFLVSDVQAVPPGASRIGPGRPYSLLTLIFGWWSLAGVFCVIKALTDNFRGGIDVSSNVLAAARGEPLLPRRGDGLERRW
jgi:hypothetical protein